MKANVPRQLASLSKADRRKLAQEMDDAFNRDVMIVLDIWLKMSVTVLHDACSKSTSGLSRAVRRWSILTAACARSSEKTDILMNTSRKCLKIGT